MIKKNLDWLLLAKPHRKISEQRLTHVYRTSFPLIPPYFFNFIDRDRIRGLTPRELNKIFRIWKNRKLLHPFSSFSILQIFISSSCDTSIKTWQKYGNFTRKPLWLTMNETKFNNNCCPLNLKNISTRYLSILSISKI
jgi:hypothetical protein